MRYAVYTSHSCLASDAPTSDPPLNLDRQPGAESRRERELEQREEFGYIGTYFEHRQEEDEDIDQDGYIKVARVEARTVRLEDVETRTAATGAVAGETSAWESECRKMDIGRPTQQR